MKVNIQNHEIQLEKIDGNWSAPNLQSLEILAKENNYILLQTQNKTVEIQCTNFDAATKTVTLLYNNQKYSAKITEPLDELLKSMGLENALTPKISEVKAPMPGLVINILVAPGDVVEANQKLVTLEAMKMENAIKSPAAGTIASIEVKAGEAVDKNQVLLRFE